MKLKTFMILNAIPALIFGILMVVIPSILVRWFGLTLDKGLDIDGQLYGSELILMGLVCWFARGITEPKAQRGILSAFVIANFISLVLTFIAEFNHTLNPIGWIAIAFYFILTVVYGYYLFLSPGEMREKQQVNQPS